MTALGDVVTAGQTYGGLDGNSNAGSGDIFVTKLDSAGSRLWTYQAGTSNFETALGVDADAAGDIVVVGYTSGGLNGNSNSGNDDMFVLKLDSSLSQQWTYQTGTSGEDHALAVRIDSSGDVVVVGYTFGALHGKPHAGHADIVVMKLGDTGSRQWTYQTGTSGRDQAMETALDVSGDILVTGYTSGSLHGNSHLGNRDNFVLQLDSAGSWQGRFRLVD